MLQKLLCLTLALAGSLAFAGIASAQVSTAAAMMAGQRISACKDDLRFAFTVVRADTLDQIEDYPSSPDTVWLIVVADVTNQGARAENAQLLADVRDDQGRIIGWTVFPGPDQYIEDAAAARYGVTPSWRSIAPGQTVRTVLTYFVPTDVRRLTLVANDGLCTVSAAAPAGPASPAPPAAPVVPASPPAPAPSAPPPAPLQSLDACKDGVRFRVAVARLDLPGQIPDYPPSPSTLWAIVIADITNLGNRTENAQPLVTVRDDRGRISEWTVLTGADQYIDDGLAAAYGVSPSWTAIAPGQTVRMPLTFLVADDARTVTLVPIQLNC